MCPLPAEGQLAQSSGASKEKADDPSEEEESGTKAAQMPSNISCVSRLLGGGGEGQQLNSFEGR